MGACFAATVEGEFVVDIWGGHRDAAKTEPWAEDTIVCVYSSTKTMTFLCALLLADRGELDLYAPVVKYRPEFGQNGKAATEVRHFLSHTSALPGFEPTVRGAELYDWDFSASGTSSGRRRGGRSARRAAITRPRRGSSSARSCAA